MDALLMDREVLDLVLKHPNIIEHFSSEYRERLLRLWLESSNTRSRDTSKTETTALLYSYAKRFKVSKPQIFLANYLDTNVGAIDQRLYNARQKGLINK